MTAGFDRLRLWVAACAIAAGGSGVTALADEGASSWDGDSRGAIRLIAGSWQDRASAPVRAGIEIRLKPGWHTYWRYPGDAGVPPRFDFSGSRNVGAVTVLWPAPRRMAEQGLSVIGYAEDVILPLLVLPRSRAEPVTLRLKADYALCEKLCLPSQAALALTLGKQNSPWDGALTEASARVPKKRTLGEAGELVVQSVRREGSAQGSRVVIEVAAPAGQGIDLFAEGPGPDWALPLPVPEGAAAGGRQRFALDLDGAPPGGKYEGAVITITAVAGNNAIEVPAPLD
jgi:DsbC/DsbD-like thiol-disulfide interchange protein